MKKTKGTIDINGKVYNYGDEHLFTIFDCGILRGTLVKIEGNKIGIYVHEILSMCYPKTSLANILIAVECDDIAEVKEIGNNIVRYFQVNWHSSDFNKEGAVAVIAFSKEEAEKMVGEIYSTANEIEATEINREEFELWRINVCNVEV